MRTIHHVKQIAIILFFMLFPLTFYLFVLSTNSIHNKYDNNHSGSRKITYLCKIMNNQIINSEFRSLNFFNATLTALFHAYWLDTAPVQIRWSENRSIYHSGLDYFTMATKSKNTWSFGDPLLHLLDMFVMWLNYMFEIILIPRIKYYDSRNRDNFFDEKMFNLVFLFDQI